MKVRLIACLFIFLNASVLFAQNEKEPKKISFIIHCSDASVNKQKYENAATNYGKLDQFRFYNKRRIIQFKNTNVSIELYSAKELFDVYKKQISPYTITSDKEFRKAEFVLTGDEQNIIPQFE